MAKFETVDQYVASFPPSVQEVLEELRRTIRRAAPGCDESIRYNMPCVKLDGRYVVHFAAWKQHIGMYPIPVFDGPFEHEVAPYRSSKDTIRLPYRRSIPYDLVERLVVRLVGSRQA